MPISVGEIIATLSLKDQLTQGLKNAQAQLAKTGKTLQEAGRAAAEAGQVMSIGLTVPLVAAAGASLKFSADFETAMTKVGTLTDIGTKGVGEMRDKILDMAPAVGVGPKPLADALLVVASTGIKGAAALDILEQSAKASAVGLGDAKDIARAVTSAITAYGASNISAAEASNKLFVAVREGGAEADEFAGTLGRVVGIAAQVGVSFDEVLASIASFTRLGVSAAEATTALRGVMSTLLKPSKEARQELEGLGTSIDELRKSVKEKGLAVALTELVELTHGNEDALAHVIPNVRALAGVMGTAGAQADAYKSVLANIAISTNELGDAFGATSKTLGFQWNKALAEGQKILIQFGDAIAPAFRSVLDASHPVMAAIESMITSFAALPEPLRTTTVALLALVAAAGPLLYGFGQLTRIAGIFASAASLVADALFVVGNSTVVMTARLWLMGDAVAAANMASFGGSLLALAGPFAAVVALIGALTYEFHKLREGQGTTADEIKKDAYGLDDYGVSLGKIKNAAKSAADAQHDLKGGAEEVYKTISGKRLADEVDNLTAAWKKLSSEGAPTAQQFKAVGEAARALQSQGANVGTALLDVIAKLPPAVAAVTPHIVSLAQQLKNADDQVARLTATQKANIEAGLKLGQTEKEVAEAVHVSEQVVNRYNDKLKETKKTTDDAKEALDDFRKEMADNAAAFENLFKKGDDAERRLEAEDEQSAIDESVAQNKDYYDRIKKLADDDKAYRDKIGQDYLDAELRRWERSAEGTRAAYDSAKRSGLATTEELDKLWQDWFERRYAEMVPWLGSWMQSLDQLSSAFQALAQISDGSFGAIAKDIGTLFASLKLAAQGTKTMQKGMEEIHDGKTVAGLMDLAAGAGSIAAAFLQATENGNALTKTLKGMAVGAQTGAQIGSMFGPMGKAIGAGIGAAAGGIAGLFRGLFGASDAEKELKKTKDAITKWEESIDFEDFKKKAAEAGVSLDAIFNARTVKDFDAAVKEAKKEIDAYAQTQKNAETFSKLFASTLDDVAKSGTLASAGLRDMMAKVEALGGDGADAIKKFREASTGSAAGGLNGVVDAMIGPWLRANDVIGESAVKMHDLIDKSDQLKLKINELTEARDKGGKFTEKDALQLRIYQDELKATTEEIDKYKQKLKDAQAILADGGKAGQEAFDRMGRLAVASFSASIQSGAGFLQALQLISPALDELNTAQEKLGFTSSGTLTELLKFSDFAKTNADVIAGLDGVNTMLVGLSNSGLLDQQTFSDLGDTAADMYQKMIDGGVSGDQALRAMQPSLQTLWQLHEDFGFVLDANTQKLVDQGLTAGIVGEQHRAADDQIAKSLAELVTLFKDFLTIMGKAPSVAAQAAGAINAAGDSVESWPAPWDDWGDPPSYDNGGGSDGGGEQNGGDANSTDTGGGSAGPGFAGGTPGLGFMDFGSGTAATLHGREAVVPIDRAGDFASQHASSDAVEDKLDELLRAIRALPDAIGIAARDARQGRG